MTIKIGIKNYTNFAHGHDTPATSDGDETVATTLTGSDETCMVSSDFRTSYYSRRHHFLIHHFFLPTDHQN